MPTYPIDTLLRLRKTLRILKRSGALEDSFKLQYAVDKTLRDLAPEHGNSEAHALEAFDDTRDELIESYADTDDEGRILYEHQETSAVVGQEEDQWLYAERHENGEETHEAGDRWGGPEKAQAEAQHLAYVLTDENQLQEDLEELRQETVEVDVHTVSPEVLAQIDLSQVGRQIDTSVLEVMEASE